MLLVVVAGVGRLWIERKGRELKEKKDCIFRELQGNQEHRSVLWISLELFRIIARSMLITPWSKEEGGAAISGRVKVKSQQEQHVTCKTAQCCSPGVADSTEGMNAVLVTGQSEAHGRHAHGSGNEIKRASELWLQTHGCRWLDNNRISQLFP